MIISFTPDLKRQDIYANGNELVRILGMDYDASGARVASRPNSEKERVVSFDDPVLVTDNYKIGGLDSVQRDTVFALYSSHQKRIEYDSTSMDFELGKFPKVWSPSIDTLLLCRSLKYLKENYDLEFVRAAAEIGSGSGFISKYTLDNNPQIDWMTLVDIEEQAKECAIKNIDDTRMKAIVDTGMEYLAGKRLDLVICNPPYIPRKFTVEKNPYEGIGLLSGLIRESPNYLTNKGILLVNIPSLCEKKSVSLMKETGLKYDKIDTLTVPLKVFSVLNNKAWMDYLLDNGSLIKDHHDGYDYWQTLNIYDIRRKN